MDDSGQEPVDLADLRVALNRGDSAGLLDDLEREIGRAMAELEGLGTAPANPLARL